LHFPSPHGARSLTGISLYEARTFLPAVRTTNGVLVSVTQPTNPSLYAGQKVFIEGSGDGARVVLR
jgi:hypothetical protein